MPSLKAVLPGLPLPQSFSLRKNLTSIGRAPDNDVVLDVPSVAATHAQVYCDGGRFAVSVIDKKLELAVNGKKLREAFLSHRDRISVGGVELEFHLFDDASAATARARRPESELAGLKKLFEFSSRLTGVFEIDSLLESLMDSVIAISNADKGFLILVEDGQFRFKVARNFQRENIADAVEKVSDSILAKVVRERQPVIVSDAQSDDELKNSLSVVSLALCSVMCVPLLEKGEILGIIYVGNNNVVNLFTKSDLEVLSVFAAQASLILQNAMLVRGLRSENVELAAQLKASQFGALIGDCGPMRRVYVEVEKVAPTDVTVLLTGETGTGKELVARELHNRSARRDGPFVSINCGAIPENLLESELFGHARGAFTGATQSRIGRFVAATRGTLFLDEIGEMPLHLQVKILNALQDRAVTPVGEVRPVPIDIRIVAATNRPLEDDIRDGRFREDLYYRLNVVQLRLPPLRDRGDDILVIAKFLLQQGTKGGRVRAEGFSPQAIEAMSRYAWPGNVRELENRVRRAAVMADASVIGIGDLGLDEAKVATRELEPLAAAEESFRRRYIEEALVRNQGNRTKTARELGVDPRTIFRFLEKTDLNKD